MVKRLDFGTGPKIMLWIKYYSLPVHKHVFRSHIIGNASVPNTLIWKCFIFRSWFISYAPSLPLSEKVLLLHSYQPCYRVYANCSPALSGLWTETISCFTVLLEICTVFCRFTCSWIHTVCFLFFIFVCVVFRYLVIIAVLKCIICTVIVICSF